MSSSRVCYLSMDRTEVSAATAIDCLAVDIDVPGNVDADRYCCGWKFSLSCEGEMSPCWWNYGHDNGVVGDGVVVVVDDDGDFSFLFWECDHDVPVEEFDFLHPCPFHHDCCYHRRHHRCCDYRRRRLPSYRYRWRKDRDDEPHWNWVDRVIWTSLWVRR